MQVHGGMGFMKDAGIERVYRISRAARIGEGTSEIQRQEEEEEAPSVPVAKPV